MNINDFKEYFPYIIESLKQLGGSGRNDEILDKIAELANLSSEQIEQMHTNTRTVFDYNCAWAKTYLKNYGYLDNSSRGVWVLNDRAYKEEIPEASVIVNFFRNRIREGNNNNNLSVSQIENTDIENNLEFNQDNEQWIENLLLKLRNLSPEKFERLCVRILREKGFSDMETTGGTGDGGIDGKGVLKISLLSFKVNIQCKRYNNNNSVTAGDIRNFRGSFSGNFYEKGIFMTTGRFTSGAKAEAKKDNADIIELIDGIDLCHLLKELNLGVNITERIDTDDTFLNNI